MTKDEFLKIPGVKDRLEKLATKHGFTVDEILTVIQKESGFKTTAENPKSKATGLIQFMPDTAKGLGTTIEKIKEMDALAQLEIVDKYFTQNHTKGQHPYVTVAYPAAAKMDMDDIVAPKDSIIAKQNPVWQDKDGNVTKRSILGYVGAEDRDNKTEKKVEKPKQSRIVLGPNGEEIEIEIGEDISESDIRKKESGGEQRYKSWKELEDNIDKLDKSRPFYIDKNRYKWNEDKQKVLLVDEEGEYLPEERQGSNEEFQEIFRGPRIEVKGGTKEGETPKEIVEKKIITPPTVEKEEKSEKKYSPLEKGMYQDDEGNIWRKGDEGGWQVKYNRAAKGVPEVNEYGEPSFEMEFKYDKEWSALSKDDEFDEPWTNTEQFESQLTPYNEGVFKGDASKEVAKDDPTTDPNYRMNQLGNAGKALFEGAGKVLDYVGGPGGIISYVMGKKGLKEAMKEVKPHASAQLSPIFMQHLRQSREIAKKGFHPDQARVIQKEMDGAYQKGLENAVRGSGGQRARFLASSGILDAQRSSALLQYAAQDSELQSKNQEKYEKLMMFKENFDIQQTEKERAEDMERQVANKKAAATFTSAAFTNLMSNFGGSSSLLNKKNVSNIYNTIEGMMTNQGNTGTNE